LRVVSNWLLALSIGSVGTGVLEMVTGLPRMALIMALSAVGVGVLLFVLSVVISGEMEKEDE